MSLPLAERYLYLFQIEKEIKNKKGMLVKKKKELEKKKQIKSLLKRCKPRLCKIL